MPTEERIPMIRRGERVDDGGDSRRPTAEMGDKRIDLLPPGVKPPPKSLAAAKKLIAEAKKK